MKQLSHNPARWVARTGVLTALLIALQWSTVWTQSFAGQYITGTCVNCVLAVAALFAGFWSGAAVAVLSPFFAFAFGIGPKLLQIVPCIAIGNLVLVSVLYLFAGRKQQPAWRKIAALILSAAAKFAVLYTAVVWVVIPLMGDALKPKQVQTFTVMFSWPQLITALLGVTAALAIVPVLKKAIIKQ